MKFLNIIGLLLLSFAFNPQLIAQNEDADGCTDHPMFNRMPNYHIQECINKEFDAFSFPVQSVSADDAKKQSVEGRYYLISYARNEGTQEASALQIFRNYENALKQIKATIVAKVVEDANSYSFITAKVLKNNMETWILINAWGVDYQLTIVEKQLMEQVIQASEMLTALNTDGFIALDILFDIGKATIKQESQGIMDQIFELLKSNPGLKISIEGHTDNTGTPVGNKTLSEERAKAVADALISRGIDKSRLASKGWGQEKPVADNRTEDGRAKNRRVEIVKM
jgi:outer membrane protein OmpA-like peptidoglycan-associated protein